jgi:DHA1 family bicyclomycin/chloramphenicol resistance-like MFS transporter
MEARRTPFVILPLLGALSVISPFSIDMYLTAFPQVAGEFAVSTNAISLTLSAYFIGLAGGQLFYGPLLDRFGRRPPLFFGLTIFLLASIGCAVATDIRVLIALRFLQGWAATAPRWRAWPWCATSFRRNNPRVSCRRCFSLSPYRRCWRRLSAG